MKNYIIAVLIGIGIAACMLVMFIIGRERGYGQGYSDAMNQPHKPDTVWKTETVTIEKPVPYYVEPSGVEMFPVGTLAQLQAKIDSLRAAKPDTTFVEIPVPIETQKYGGQEGDEYEAQVSGWHPSLDWIKVYPKTAYITNTVVEKKRWSFGVTAGPGVLWDGTLHGGVAVVVGVQYNL